MDSLLKFLYVFLILLGVFIFQISRIFTIFQIQPNLLLIFLLVLVFIIPKSGKGVLFLGIFFLSFSFFIFFFFRFWLLEIIVLQLLAVAGIFMKNFLTGDNITDFLIVLFAANIFFYIIINIQTGLIIPWKFISIELLCNLAIGLLIIQFFMNSYKVRIFKN